MSHHHDVRDDIPPDTSAGHEKRDLSTRVVAIFGISLIIGAAVVHVVIWLLFLYFGNLHDRAYPREYPLAQVGAPRQAPEPRLQEKPREDLKRLRAEERRILQGYGWVDQQRGVVHIPIERAMELLLQQGLPVRAQAPQPAVGGLPQDSSSGRTYASRD